MVGELLRRVVLLRLRKRRGPAWIAWRTELAPATVYRALRRHRLHRLRLLEPREPVVRYCWPHAGDLVHLDTKRLGRIGAGGGKRFGGRGSRTATAASAGTTPTWPSTTPRGWPTPRSSPTSAARPRPPSWSALWPSSPATAIEVRRLLTDNGSCYRSHAFAAAADAHGLRHWHTQPYRPQTNGKAEAFVKIVQNGWAYKRPYDSTAERIAALPRFLRYYNGYRPHGGLDGDTPLGRLRSTTS